MSIYSHLLRNITLSCLNHCANRQWGRLAEISSGSHLESFSSSALHISFPQRIKILLLSPASGEGIGKRRIFSGWWLSFCPLFPKQCAVLVMTGQFLGVDELCPGCMGMERSGQNKGLVRIFCQGWWGVWIPPACWWLCLSWSLPPLELPKMRTQNWLDITAHPLYPHRHRHGPTSSVIILFSLPLLPSSFLSQLHVTTQAQSPALAGKQPPKEWIGFISTFE